jgi:hypothetical protein
MQFGDLDEVDVKTIGDWGWLLALVLLFFAQ